MKRMICVVASMTVARLAGAGTRISRPGIQKTLDMASRANQYYLESEDGAMGIEFTFPRCRKCGAGDLVPLSDFGSQGAPIQFKAWVCTNPNCLYNIKIRNGDVIVNEPVSDASLHPYRTNR